MIEVTLQRGCRGYGTTAMLTVVALFRAIATLSVPLRGVTARRTLWIEFEINGIILEGSSVSLEANNYLHTFSPHPQTTQQTHSRHILVMLSLCTLS